jgi:hypothetical protein
MSDSDEPSQQPTPSKTPKRPQPPVRSDSEQSIEDPGYQSGRSRSQSRRRRRQNQRQRAQQQQQQNQPGGGSHGAQTTSMAKIDEEKGAEAETQAQTATMKPFERIGTLGSNNLFLSFLPFYSSTSASASQWVLGFSSTLILPIYLCLPSHYPLVENLGILLPPWPALFPPPSFYCQPTSIPRSTPHRGGRCDSHTHLPLHRPRLDLHGRSGHLRARHAR